ncbi:MAG: hypothetical protein J6G98_05315, partial [Bacilli bacterium]|nr:hypothetical protein [Bacilli bacterium]
SSDTDKLISFKGSVKEGVAIIKPNGKTIICLTDGKNSAYKNYNEDKISLISGKVCTVPSNRPIVYLDGEATLSEMTNQELTDKIAELESLISNLQREKASKDELNAVATIASNAQDKADSSASATNLESVATIANQAKALAEAAASSSDLEALSTIANSKASINDIYPVGSIYMSTTDNTVAKVQAKLGGTWEVYGDGKMIKSSTSTAGTTGGSNTVTLSTLNLPNHAHTYTPSGTVKSTFTGSQVTTGNQSANPTISNSSTFSSPWVTRGIAVYGYRKNTTAWTLDGGFDVGTFNHNGTARQDDFFLGWKTASLSNSGNHTHNVTAKGTVSSTFTGTSASTTACTNCSASSFSVENEYITVYMYKRTA